MFHYNPCVSMILGVNDSGLKVEGHININLINIILSFVGGGVRPMVPTTNLMAGDLVYIRGILSIFNPNFGGPWSHMRGRS